MLSYSSSLALLSVSQSLTMWISIPSGLEALSEEYSSDSDFSNDGTEPVESIISESCHEEEDLTERRASTVETQVEVKPKKGDPFTWPQSAWPLT